MASTRSGSGAKKPTTRWASARFITTVGEKPKRTPATRAELPDEPQRRSSSHMPMALSADAEIRAALSAATGPARSDSHASGMPRPRLEAASSTSTPVGCQSSDVHHSPPPWDSTWAGKPRYQSVNAGSPQPQIDDD